MLLSNLEGVIVSTLFSCTNGKSKENLEFLKPLRNQDEFGLFEKDISTIFLLFFLSFTKPTFLTKVNI